MRGFLGEGAATLRGHSTGTCTRTKAGLSVGGSQIAEKVKGTLNGKTPVQRGSALNEPLSFP